MSKLNVLQLNSISVIEVFSVLFLIYGLIIISGYIFSAFFSIFEIRDYKRRNNFQDDAALLQSANLPAISVLAPAYNEEANVVENIRSLLTLNYPSFEIVVINDGSKDNSLQRLIETFQLEKQELIYYHHVQTKKIKGIYKSKIKAYKNLRVIDKENGGKADALNTGINCCIYDLICCIDVDCILERL